jgi:F-type H+-transporting ATPase subunit delta
VFHSIAQTSYHPLTVSFLDTVIDAGRLSDLEKIIEKYISYCKILNKEEDIKVISAKALTEEQKTMVAEAIKKNKPDVKFKLTYQIDHSIMGGLQIYAGTEFLDCSLRSRMQRLKAELSKI